MNALGWQAWLLGMAIVAGSTPLLAADTKPNSFGLVNATVFKDSRGLPGATHSTKPVMVQGIDSPSPISITDPGQYSINGGSFQAAPATVRQGDRVVVRLTASESYDANVATKLTIGGVNSSFSLRTILNPSATLTTIPGTTAFVYRDTSPAKLSIFIYKPVGWLATDLRPALICFFGGGWVGQDPAKKPIAKGLAGWAASQGMVGITPDIRTNERFATAPQQNVDDARAALRWVQDNHASLGVDPARIVTCGSSSGGHLALWTAIPASPPGSSPATAPVSQPAATILISGVVDTSAATGHASGRMGADAIALSPFHQLPGDMPPILMFHATADKIVRYSRAVSFCDALLSGGNVCELTTINGAGHTWFSDKPSLRQPTYDRIGSFLRQLGILD